MTGANVLANATMTLASLAFYLMLFSNAAPGINARQVFGTRSYWAVKIGLSFFVAGSAFSTLAMYEATLPQFVRNVGTAILFAWAALFHARKWGVIVGVKRLDRVTGSYPVIK
jgi:hypothetical protein